MPIGQQSARILPDVTPWYRMPTGAEASRQATIDALRTLLAGLEATCRVLRRSTSPALGALATQVIRGLRRATALLDRL